VLLSAASWVSTAVNWVPLCAAVYWIGYRTLKPAAEVEGLVQPLAL